MRKEENINQGGGNMELDLSSYDKIIIAFSGGKDSEACILTAIEQGADINKMELWHHEVDGKAGTFMDWPVTADYCRKFARAFGIQIYFSWKQGGFKREMLRDKTLTAPTSFETPEGVVTVGGTRGKENTRLKFPQVSPDLSVRWCSAYLKIDVCAAALRNQDRFNNSRTLVITGERAEESASRAKYKTFEPHKADNRNGKKARHIDHWRPVHAWPEQAVWDILRRHKVNPHPAYKLGWGRVSCASCIFGSKDQWASLFHVAPDHVNQIVHYEKLFNVTINRNKSIPELIIEGKPYANMKAEHIKEAMTEDYSEDIITSTWELPAGAFGESCGPV